MPFPHGTRSSRRWPARITTSEPKHFRSGRFAAYRISLIRRLEGSLSRAPGTKIARSTGASLPPLELEEQGFEGLSQLSQLVPILPYDRVTTSQIIFTKRQISRHCTVYSGLAGLASQGTAHTPYDVN